MTTDSASSSTAVSSAPVPQLQPAVIDPIVGPRPFEKIPTNLEQKKVALIVSGIFSLGIIPFFYFVYQAVRLKNALVTGNLDQAESRIKAGGWALYQHVIDSDRFRSLAASQPDSVRLLSAQIDWSKEVISHLKKDLTADRTGWGSSHEEILPLSLSKAAEALIGARDGDECNVEANAEMIDLVPTTLFPSTYMRRAYSSWTADHTNRERILDYGDPQTHRTLSPHMQHPDIQHIEQEKAAEAVYVVKAYIREIKRAAPRLTPEQIYLRVMESAPNCNERVVRQTLGLAQEGTIANQILDRDTVNYLESLRDAILNENPSYTNEDVVKKIGRNLRKDIDKNTSVGRYEYNWDAILEYYNKTHPDKKAPIPFHDRVEHRERVVAPVARRIPSPSLKDAHVGSGPLDVTNSSVVPNEIPLPSPRDGLTVIAAIDREEQELDREISDHDSTPPSSPSSLVSRSLDSPGDNNRQGTKIDDHKDSDEDASLATTDSQSTLSSNSRSSSSRSPDKVGSPTLNLPLTPPTNLHSLAEMNAQIASVVQ